ncbi:MAG: hypothetical protein KF715_19160 [Candidatus Didemnitutus sp.]|nr:hypothetical protein [Candidatus Didemnitutus sp.]
MKCQRLQRAAFAGWLAVCGAVGSVAAALPDYDLHVIYDNSPASGGYYNTETGMVAPSFIERVGERLPTTTERFVSPPNALKLHWKSASGGAWHAVIKDPGRDWRKLKMVGDTLAFWCWSDTEITPENSPRITMQDANNYGASPETLVSGDARLPAKQWVRVRLKLNGSQAIFRDTSDAAFKMEDAVAVIFTQGLDDGAEHTLYLDDFVIMDSKAAAAPAPDAPRAVQVTAYERHFDVSWQPSRAENVIAYRIYRSVDGGKTFVPVGTQRNAWTRFMDWAGAPGKQACYKVTALDLEDRESPLSDASAVAMTRPMTDDELLEMVQLACFRYYWEAGHANSGLAPEILPGKQELMALGGNGFGVMALVVATERQWITRDQATERLQKILRFLDSSPRFHGAWAHFLDARDGKVIPYFGLYDNGADLVETAFMIQGLLTARQYFDRDTPAESAIRDTVTRFWREVEWAWFRKEPNSDFLWWHWSPDHGFHIDHPLIGWNESMIIYLLAIASPTHSVPASLYHTGWAGQSELAVRYRRGWSRTTQGDHFVNGNSYYGIKLEVGEGPGAELFFTHFSYMAFDPRGKRDAYTNYFKNNRAIAQIARAYCMANPRGFAGYGPDCWGRSAGVNNGGGRPEPRDDNGTINVMASLSSMPYTPEESMAALKHFYRDLGDRVWGTYGFHDGFNETWNWFDEDYMALNQAPIVVMIENHRTGLIWNKFMANPEIAPALDRIGFKPDPEPVK